MSCPSRWSSSAERLASEPCNKAATAFSSEPSKKRVEHAAERRAADLGAAARGGVDVPPLLRAMLEMPLVNEDRQQRPHGGIAGRIGQGGMDVGRRGFALGVHDVHDLSFAAAQRVGGCLAHSC